HQSHLGAKSHTYYEHANFESFTCWKFVATEEVEETASSGMVDTTVVGASDVPKAPALRRLSKDPSVATPSDLLKKNATEGRDLKISMQRNHLLQKASQQAEMLGVLLI
nr:hypothetical protein [Tanacetum cinerariifolium]